MVAVGVEVQERSHCDGTDALTEVFCPKEMATLGEPEETIPKVADVPAVSTAVDVEVPLTGFSNDLIVDEPEVPAFAKTAVTGEPAGLATVTPMVA